MREIITYTLCFFWSFSAFSQSGIELNTLAYEQIEKGQLDSGFVYVNLAIMEDSTFYGSYYNRGVIYQELGKPNLAIKDFSKSIDYNSIDIASYMNRGVLYSELEDYNSALGDFSTVIKLDSTNKVAYFNIGLIGLNTKDFYRAEMAFKKCIELDSLYHSAIFRLGKVYLFSQNYDAAFESFNLCISIYDQNPEYFEFRGIMNFMKGEKEAGCKDLERAAELGDLNPRAIDIQKQECQ